MRFGRFTWSIARHVDLVHREISCVGGFTAMSNAHHEVWVEKDGSWGVTVTRIIPPLV